MMQVPKLRKTLILFHLYAAAIFAPAFVLVALSGGGYLLGNKGAVEKSALDLPLGAHLDRGSDNLQGDVEALLKTSGLEHKFEYLKVQGDTIYTRPTSRPYIEFVTHPAGLKAYMVTPNLQKRMLELHFGHGPKIFKIYQKLVAASLILIVFGGVLIGLLAPAFRLQTIIALLGGMGVFFGLICLG